MKLYKLIGCTALIAMLVHGAVAHAGVPAVRVVSTLVSPARATLAGVESSLETTLREIERTRSVGDAPHNSEEYVPDFEDENAGLNCFLEFSSRVSKALFEEETEKKRDAFSVQDRVSESLRKNTRNLAIDLDIHLDDEWEHREFGSPPSSGIPGEKRKRQRERSSTRCR